MSPRHISKVPEFIKDNKGKDIPRRAVAPYNFVELPEKVVEAQPLPDGDRYHLNRYTGRIECTLTTESPLYTRCGWSPEDFAKYSEPPIHKTKEEKERWEKKEKAQWEKERKEILAPFFSYPYDNIPVILGSSIRGMLRTLVEIVSFGKIDRVSDQQLIYRAVGDTSSLGEKYRERLLEKQTDNSYKFLMKAGYLIKEGSSWKIQPAQPIKQGTSFARIEEKDIPENLESWYGCRNAHKISVSVDPIEAHPHGKRKKIQLKYAKAHHLPKHEYNGVLVTTGSVSGKHMEFVFGKPSENSNEAIPISTKMIEQYKEQITDGQIKLLGEDAALRSMQPIFYITENNKLLFFGHAMMFRLPYENNLIDYIPKDLTKIGLIDLADAIFGWVKQETEDKKLPQQMEKQRAGRVFITDAIYQNNKDGIWYENNPVTPQILASPKTTTFQHYLVQPKETNADPKNLKHYASEPVTETVIRGHKLYWHKGNNPNFKLPKPKKVIDSSKKDKVNVSDTQTTLIKPVNKGVTFKFGIHFENLSDVELGALLWVLSLSSDKSQQLETGKTDEKYCFSLGMGKPLGMGAVKIDYDLHLSDRKERYSQLFDDDGWSQNEKDQDKVTQAEINCISEFEKYVLDRISENDYPDNQNRQQIEDLRQIPRIEMLLAMLRCDPPPEETDYMELEQFKDRKVLPTPLDIRKIKDKRRFPANSTPSSKPKPQNKSDRPKQETENPVNLALQRGLISSSLNRL